MPIAFSSDTSGNTINFILVGPNEFLKIDWVHIAALFPAGNQTISLRNANTVFLAPVEDKSSFFIIHDFAVAKLELLPGESLDIFRSGSFASCQVSVHYTLGHIPLFG